MVFPRPGTDVALKTSPPPEIPAPAAAPRPTPPGELPVPSSAAEIPIVRGRVVPFSAVRKAIAQHMVESKRTSPHVTTVMEADLSRVVRHLEANKANFARDGARLTFTAYFVSAAVAALQVYPLVNASWSEEGLRIHAGVHIGLAVSLAEDGLIVPVIRSADGLSLLGTARAVNDLADRARSRQLKPDEVKGGTFTITNHGTSGSLLATPIINQPQIAILGVGAIQKRVVVIEDAIAIRPMVYLSLTFDHRVLDGYIADQFLGKIVTALENWV
jgi:2-oxoglutarate dehydrogenase E2 component (dihydrolipoamide succinyltransferase)